VFIVLIAFSCLGLLSCVFFYVLSKGFPYKDQIEELFIVVVYCMYFQFS